jgi:hypothetical protein
MGNWEKKVLPDRGMAEEEELRAEGATEEKPKGMAQEHRKPQKEESKGNPVSGQGMRYSTGCCHCIQDRGPFKHLV